MLFMSGYLVYSDHPLRFNVTTKNKIFLTSSCVVYKKCKSVAGSVSTSSCKLAVEMKFLILTFVLTIVVVSTLADHGSHGQGGYGGGHGSGGSHGGVGGGPGGGGSHGGGFGGGHGTGQGGGHAGGGQGGGHGGGHGGGQGGGHGGGHGGGGGYQQHGY